MKRALMIVTTAALVSASAPAARAGDREWATAGKVLAGVGAGLLLTRALQPEPVYAAPPVYVQPAPVVVQQPVYVQAQPVQVGPQPAMTGGFVQAQPIGVPQPVVVPQPVYVQAQPVVIQAQPAVVYQPAPVVYAAPVYVHPAPVYVHRPAIGFQFSFGSHGHYHRRGHGHW